MRKYLTLIKLDIFDSFLRFWGICPDCVVLKKSFCSEQWKTPWTTQHAAYHVFCRFLQPVSYCIFEFLIINHKTCKIKFISNHSKRFVDLSLCILFLLSASIILALTIIDRILITRYQILLDVFFHKLLRDSCSYSWDPPGVWQPVVWNRCPHLEPRWRCYAEIGRTRTRRLLTNGIPGGSTCTLPEMFLFCF